MSATDVPTQVAQGPSLSNELSREKITAYVRAQLAEQADAMQGSLENQVNLLTAQQLGELAAQLASEDGHDEAVDYLLGLQQEKKVMATYMEQQVQNPDNPKENIPLKDIPPSRWKQVKDMARTYGPTVAVLGAALAGGGIGWIIGSGLAARVALDPKVHEMLGGWAKDIGGKAQEWWAFLKQQVGLGPEAEVPTKHPEAIEPKQPLGEDPVDPTAEPPTDGDAVKPEQPLGPGEVKPEVQPPTDGGVVDPQKPLGQDPIDPTEAYNADRHPTVSPVPNTDGVLPPDNLEPPPLDLSEYNTDGVLPPDGAEEVDPSGLADTGLAV